MSKEDCVVTEGIVIKNLPNATFKVRLENGHEVLTYISGKIRKNNIGISTGDRVEVACSLYDLDKGRIIFRK